MNNMNNTELLSWLYDNGFFLSDGRCNPQALKKLSKHPTVFSLIVDRFRFLGDNYTFAQLVHAIRNELIETPKCPICANNIKFDKSNSTYPTTCSPKCGAVYSPNKTFKIRSLTSSEIQVRGSNKRNNYLKEHPELTDQQWLQNKHVVQLYSIVEIAKELGVVAATVRTALSDYNIEVQPKNKLREASNLRKYGVNNIGSLPDVRTKARQTSIDRYGSLARSSKGEQELKNFLTDNNISIQENNQHIISPYELDIYLPDYQIAIEFCGLYWHGEQYRDRTYHQRKLKSCNNKGIRLITLFDDEWNTTSDLIKNKLLHILGKSQSPRIFARQTHVNIISNSDKDAFFNRYHIQGTGPGSITYGLFCNKTTEMVGGMTFIRQNNGKYVLNRYATSAIVVGGFNKLLSYFCNHHEWEQILSFADLRWSDGEIYKQSGFVLDSILPPDYQYIINKQRVHKFNFRRKFLEKRLKHFDPLLSEWENCKANGIDRIWDCGKLRFVMTKEEIM